jgi:glycosyltransferase involved in cell wall biosynthesis
MLDMKNSFSLSICIPTFNRPLRIKELLKNILQQDVLPDEIVIVDSSSNRDTEDTVNSFEQSDIPIIYKQSEKGLTLQRNSAVDSANGEIIMFLDDDIVLDPEFVQGE